MVKEKECKGCHEVLHVLDFWTGGGITIFKHLLYRREKSNLNHLNQYNRTVNTRSSVLSFPDSYTELISHFCTVDCN